MNFRPLLKPILILVLVGFAAGAAWSKSFPTVHMKKAFPHLKFKMPVWLEPSPDNSGRLFVVEQKGRIRVFKNSPSVKKAPVFLDIHKKVRTSDGEEGLLAMAFHPAYATNGYFYVYYIASNPHREVLSRFKVSTTDPNKADPKSEKVLLEVPKVYGNHNGCTLLFGPDGYLYFGLGDGGAGGDPHNNAQNLGSLFGKIMRIDVDHEDAGLAYAIPKDNPFVGSPGARGEVWAYGIRNPWRMSFDRLTGELWVGDVGQDMWEEIDIVKKGGNYGWSIREGKHEYNVTRSSKDTLIEPILDYPHKPTALDKSAAYGPCLTGGYVYRGKKLKGMEGAYLYAEYVLGWVRALRVDKGQVTADETLIEQPENISSFGEDAAGELYLLGYSNGRIYRLEQ